MCIRDRYKENRDLFEGKHDKVFKDWIRLLRDDQQATLEIILNWPKRLSTLFADLLFGEPPGVEAGDEGSQEQEVVTRIIEDNNLFNTAYEVAPVSYTHLGKLYRAEGGVGGMKRG